MRELIKDYAPDLLGIFLILVFLTAIVLVIYYIKSVPSWAFWMIALVSGVGIICGASLIYFSKQKRKEIRQQIEKQKRGLV